MILFPNQEGNDLYMLRVCSRNFSETGISCSLWHDFPLYSLVTYLNRLFHKGLFLFASPLPIRSQGGRLVSQPWINAFQHHHMMSLIHLPQHFEGVDAVKCLMLGILEAAAGRQNLPYKLRKKTQAHPKILKYYVVGKDLQ